MSHKQWQKQIQYTIPLVTHSAKIEEKKGTTGNFTTLVTKERPLKTDTTAHWKRMKLQEGTQ